MQNQRSGIHSPQSFHSFVKLSFNEVMERPAKSAPAGSASRPSRRHPPRLRSDAAISALPLLGNDARRAGFKAAQPAPAGLSGCDDAIDRSAIRRVTWRGRVTRNGPRRPWMTRRPARRDMGKDARAAFQRFRSSSRDSGTPGRHAEFERANSAAKGFSPSRDGARC